MRTPDDQQTALECLRLATEHGAKAEEVVDRAERYFAFVTGEAEPEVK